MGSYCWINAHYPFSGCSVDEQSFIDELRPAIANTEEWYALPWEERERRREEAHQRLQIPGKVSDWRSVELSQHEGAWYIGTHVPPALTPPFPSAMSRYYPPYSRTVPTVWRVAFSAPTRWTGEWSIYQTLNETRAHTKSVFGNLWGFLYSDDTELKELRRIAPPTSEAHQRLRAVFELFKLQDLMELHRRVLSADHPCGTILELDLNDAYCEWSDVGKCISHAETFLPLLEALGCEDVKFIEECQLLDGINAYDEGLKSWLYAAGRDSTAVSSYLTQSYADDEE